MQQSKTILFFGNERLATSVTTRLPVLNQLVLNGYYIAAIILAGKSGRSDNSEVVNFAGQHQIPVHYLTDISLEKLADYKASVAILASFGSIVSQAVIDLFPQGIINIHPSLLPKHRGPIPIEAAILDNDRRTGVSIMRLSASMDSGPLYDQKSLALTGNETKQDLADQLDQTGAELLIRNLPGIITGQLTPQPQPLTGSSYDRRLTSQTGRLDFRQTAEVLERQIRAYAGWPKSRLDIQHLQLIVTAAHVESKQATDPGQISINKQQLWIDTAQDALSIDRLIPAGSKEMSSAEFIRGYGKILS